MTVPTSLSFTVPVRPHPCLCFLSLLSQWKDLFAVSRLQLDLLFHPADMDEHAGHKLVPALTVFEMHIKDVVVFIQYQAQSMLSTS